MSKCVGCNEAKDNGHPFCDECDPKGEMNAHADDPAFQAELARKQRRDQLVRELEAMDKGGKA